MTDLVYLAECEYMTALGGSVAKLLMHSRDDAEKLRRSGNKRKDFKVKSIYGLQIFTVDEAKKVIAAEKQEHFTIAKKYPNGFVTRDGCIYKPVE